MVSFPATPLSKSTNIEMLNSTFLFAKRKIVLYPIKRDTRSNPIKHRKRQPTNVPLRELSNNLVGAKQSIRQSRQSISYSMGFITSHAEPLKLDYTYNRKRIARLEEFYTIIYGEIIHFDIEKHRTYNQWGKAPGDYFQTY